MILLLVLACEPAGTTRGPVFDGDPTPITDTDTDTDPGAETDDTSGRCPAYMVQITDSSWDFCIDRYEATLADHSPFETAPASPVAEVSPGTVPQAYISGVEAEEACQNAGKRLCSRNEWLRACQGPTGTTYPYGNTYDAGACNVTRGEHPLYSLFGDDVNWSPEQMNDPRINQQDDTVDPGGANPDCVSAEGVFDLHGNLHEWIAEPSGEFRGGFYTDAAINGAGCLYRTTAHTTTYHDYSTGFRCCAD